MYRIKRKCFALSMDDIRFFLIPPLMNLSIVIFNGDLDNVLFFMIKRIILLLLIISFLRKKERIELKQYYLPK
jgi:hypothetical protein